MDETTNPVEGSVAQPVVESNAQVSAVVPEVKPEGEAKAEPEGSKDGMGELPEWAQKRFKELAAQKRRYKEEAQSIRSEVNSLKEQFAKLTPQAAPISKDDPEYVSKLVEAEISKREQERVAQMRQQEQQKVAQTEANDRIAKVRETLPDFDEVVGNSDIVLPEDVHAELAASEVGLQIAYELAKNPEMAEKLTRLTPAGRQRELLKMELRIESQVPTATAPKVAPKPMPVPSGTGGGSPRPDLNRMSVEDFVKAHRDEQAKKRGLK